MRERPIIFSGEMVRALLAGTKTMTRRVVKFCKPFADHNSWKNVYPNPNGGYVFTDGPLSNPDRDIPVITAGRIGKLCPYGNVRDRLWAKETLQYRLGAATYNVPPFNILQRFTDWKDGHNADAVFASAPFGDPLWKKRPSIYMPRWASRITLEVTGVRVERLQDITEEDARAEGVVPDGVNVRPGDGWSFVMTGEGPISYRREFSELWDSINAKRGFGWDVNPWVWCISFKRIPEEARDVQ